MLYSLGSVLSFWAQLTAQAGVSSLGPGAESEIHSQDRFWRERPALHQRISKQRFILVSVRSQRQSDGQRLRLLGAGQVRAPQAHAWARTLDFSSLPQVSSHIVEASYSEDTQRLFLHTQAFNYHARMLIQLSFPGDLPEPRQQAMDLHILEGVFAGMRARLLFDPVDDKVTEVSLRGIYDYQQFPIPIFFARFGLEVVMQRVASRLRSYVEESYGQ